MIISAKVNVGNTGGDTVFTHSVRHSIVPSVYMMTHNSNDVIARTAPAVTFSSLCSKVALLPLLSLL